MGLRERGDFLTVIEIREPFQSNKIIARLNKSPEIDGFAVC